jgi:hypothetical protein
MVTDRAQLPLSFLTSFFALNLDIFPKDPDTGDTSWPAGEALGYLCVSSPVSYLPSLNYR